MKSYPPLKLRVFVGDITALVKRRDKEVAGNGKEGDEKAERGSGEQRPQVASHWKMEGTEMAR